MNIIYDDKLFNEEIKREYMEQYKAGTKKILERIFKITASVEFELGKDLYDFSREELRRTFWLFMASTPNASRGNVQYVSNYIDWAIDEEHLDGLNPIDGTDMQWKESFVVQQQRQFFTESELNEMLNKLVNAQDQCIIALLREGVRGQEGAEIVKLKRNDIDSESGFLTLTDADGSQRKLQVSDKCLAIIERAIREEDYAKKNGNASRDVKSETTELIQNSYVIRSSNTRTINTGEADNFIIYRRLATVASEFDESSISPQSIYYSGMLSYAKKSFDETGKINYKEISERFNVSDAVIQRLKNDFLNADTIESIYAKS